MNTNNSMKYSVYNFVSQDVFTLNEKVTACCSSSDKLMIAVKSTVSEIKVYQIGKELQHLQTFSSNCSHVQQLLFCEQGELV